jgi:ribosomal protein S18 acetylase RimI-like enzyme
MTTVALRPVAPDDEDTLSGLFAAVRSEDLAMAGWDAPLRDVVLRQQFDAQRRGYRAQYPAAATSLIMIEDCPVGWTILDRSSSLWHCLDIAVVSRARRQGIATQVIRAWQDEAARTRCGIALAVLRTNAAACALYDALGFRVSGETETHWHMQW